MSDFVIAETVNLPKYKRFPVFRIQAPKPFPDGPAKLFLLQFGLGAEAVVGYVKDGFLFLGEGYGLAPGPLAKYVETDIGSKAIEPDGEFALAPEGCKGAVGPEKCLLRGVHSVLGISQRP